MAAGESAVAGTAMRPDYSVACSTPNVFIGSRQTTSRALPVRDRHQWSLCVRSCDQCRDDEFVLRVRARPGLGEPGDERERVAGLPVIRSRSPDHAQDVLQLRFPKAGLLRQCCKACLPQPRPAPAQATCRCTRLSTAKL